jgi:hypothetical protein
MKRAACANGVITVDEIAQNTPFVAVNLGSHPLPHAPADALWVRVSTRFMPSQAVR